MKEKLFSIYFCVYLFWNSILTSILGQNGIALDGSIMRMTLVGIFVLSVFFYVSTPPKIKGENKALFLLLLFGILFYSTRYRHQTTADAFQLYNGQMLRWGADCIPACLIGITLLKMKDYSYIHKILPWLCLLLTPFMAYTAITQGREQGQYVVDGGMNYQTIAYQLAVLYCYSFYYTFIYKDRKGKWVKLFIMLTMLIQAASCLMSGGRGGVVLLSVYTLYMTYFLHKHKRVPWSRIIFWGALLFITFLYIADLLGLQESSGFARSSGLLKDEDRYEQWGQYYPFLSEFVILGWGLGGDYFTVGFYSHNLIVDWLLETGIIGTCILACIFYKSFRCLYNLAKANGIFIIVMIFLIFGLIMNMFSGYWITTSSYWMAFGILMTQSYYYKKNK